MPFSAGSRAASASRVAVPAAVSTLTAALLEAAPVSSTVLGVHRPALYLDVAGRVLPVLTSDAVPLATALRLAVPSGPLVRGGVDWGVAAGDVVTVGGGRIVLPACDIVGVRTWRPARVQQISRLECGSGGSGSHFRTHGGTGAKSGWLADGIRAVLSGLECGSGCQDDHFRTHGEGVGGLLGRGQGLTPSGDDALAGILLVAHAIGVAAPLATAVRSRLGSTTAVSAALLDAAADGYAAPDVVALVDAAVAGDDATLARTLPAVLAIGHTSGRDLVAGIAAALHHFTDTPIGRSAA
jgi:hypothetical protein